MPCSWRRAVDGSTNPGPSEIPVGRSLNHDVVVVRPPPDADPTAVDWLAPRLPYPSGGLGEASRVSRMADYRWTDGRSVVAGWKCPKFSLDVPSPCGPWPVLQVPRDRQAALAFQFEPILLCGTLLLYAPGTVACAADDRCPSARLLRQASGAGAVQDVPFRFRSHSRCHSAGTSVGSLIALLARWASLSPRPIHCLDAPRRRDDRAGGNQQALKEFRREQAVCPTSATPGPHGCNIAVVPSDTEPPPAPDSMSDPLPRRLRFGGAILFAAGLVSTIFLVATDTHCNAASNLSNMAGVAGSGSAASCDGGHSILTVSYLVLVLGALLIVVGGLIMPVLRDRNARRANASPPPPAAPIDAGTTGVPRDATTDAPIDAPTDQLTD